jgi:transcriptional regulator with XRE-family HTH domain
MNKTHRSVADMAAELTGSKDIAQQVEAGIKDKRLITTLIRARMQRGLSQTDVAKQMGCTSSKISKLESSNDSSLKWDDLVKYSNAIGYRVGLQFEDKKEQPAAEQIKHHVLAIHDKLESLTQLANEIGAEDEITDKIHSFYGEVLVNFMVRLLLSYEKMNESSPEHLLSHFYVPEEQAEENHSKKDAAKTCVG